MATWAGKPEPAKWPVGTTAHLYPKPPSPWSQTGKPPGTQVTEANVASDGSLTFAGLTADTTYLAWASVGGVDQYLTIAVPPAEAGGSGGVTTAEVEALIAEKAVSTASPIFTGTPTAPTAAEGTNNTQLATTKYTDRTVSAEATTRASADATEKSAREAGDTGAAKTASNLSDLASASTARTNLGLGTAATSAASAFDTAGAAATEQTRAETAEALKLAKASNLSDLANAGTARTNLGLGSAATSASTAFDAAGAAATAQSAAEGAAATKDTTLKGEAETKDAAVKSDAEGKDATVQSTAEGASTKRSGVQSSVEASGTLVTDRHNPVTAEGAERVMKLPTGLGAGRVLSVEKTDTSANSVKVEGSIRGVGAQTIDLKLAKQSLVLQTDSAGSWWPIASHIPTTTLKEALAPIVYRTVAIPAGQVPGNELLASWAVKLRSGEKRKILWATCRTVSGTITVAIKRGAAGETEIAAYKAIAVTSTKETTTSTQELSDGDSVTVTTSAGSTPKGLFITIAEEVVAP